MAALIAAMAAAQAETRHVLFVGNSFTFGATSAARVYRADTVHDLNGTRMGGVPAVFKTMTEEAGLDYDVSIEAVGGADLLQHIADKRGLIVRPWDEVVLQSYSVLDKAHPGRSSDLIKAAQALGGALKTQNPSVRLFFTATWSRADLTYRVASPWYHQGIDKMAADIRLAYDEAASDLPGATVLPVGQSWTCAMHRKIAVTNPYDGVPFGMIDLWGWDQYHASTYGYYLEALVAFGGLTGRDPRDLGGTEKAAMELGISPATAKVLQSVAHDTLLTKGGQKPVKSVDAC